MNGKPRHQRRFERALRLTLELHELNETGQDESPEADKLRDALDPYYAWCANCAHDHLTDEQKTTLELVSVELYKDA